MAKGEKDGLGAALDIVGPGSAPLEPLQLPLHLTAGAEGETDHPDAVDGAAPARGPGRPPGSRNKRTEEWVEHLLSRYRSLLVVLAEIYSRPVGVLMKESDCDKLEAFRLQLQAAERLAPYVHQKQPIAVQVDAAGIVQLILEMPGDGPRAPAAGDDDDGDILVIEGEVLNEAPAEENAEKSTG